MDHGDRRTAGRGAVLVELLHLCGVKGVGDLASDVLCAAC